MERATAKMIFFAVLSASLALQAAAVDENVPEVLVAATDGVYRMKTDGNDKSLVAPAINATSVDYHHAKRLLFWSDVATHKIYSKDLFDNSSEIQTVVAGSDDWEPRAIAVDYVNDKIWVMDQGGRKIDVFELDGSKKVSGLMENLTEPDQGDWTDMRGPSTMDIVVDPNEGLVFYGEYNRVMRATMDFTSVQYVAHKSFVSSLTVDREMKYFYYADTERFLWEVDYSGKHQDFVNAYEHVSDYLRGVAMSPRSLSKYRGTYFWLDRREDEFPGVYMLESYSAKPVDNKIKNAWTVRVRHPSMQDTSGNKVKTQGCDNNDCQYMCLVSNPTYSKTDHSCFNENGERVVKQ